MRTVQYMVLTFVMVAVTSSAFAQLPAATILGTMRDSGGGIIPGATLGE